MFALISFYFSLLLLSLKVNSAPVPLAAQRCPNYAHYATQRYSQEVEDAIARLKPKIRDPDLFRLFENSFPNTLDTAVRWKGFAWAEEKEGIFTDEDLAFVITGDM